MAQQVESKSQASPEDFTICEQGYWNISQNVAQSANSSHGCAIGAKEVTKGVHQWLVLYESTKRCCGAIGICSTTTGKILKDCYVYSVNGTVSLYHNGDSGNCSGRHCENGSYTTIKDGIKPLARGDKIRIILDMKQKTVKFYRNEEFLFERKDLPIADRKYRLCVDGDETGDKYTILASNGGYPDISIQPLLSVLKALNKGLTEYDVTKLQQLSLTDLSELKIKTVKFMDDCKEYEQTYEDFKNRVKQFGATLDKELNPDTKGFKEWKADQICRYILSLENQRFAKYMGEFRKAVESQEIRGGDLVDITANDLLTMGVNVFRDRKDLAKYFQALGENEGTVTENIL